jgi:hypothetical protein
VILAPKRSKVLRFVKLVREARPASVICRESRLSDVRDVMVAIMRSPLSITPVVKERFRLSNFSKPEIKMFKTKSKTYIG